MAEQSAPFSLCGGVYVKNISIDIETFSSVDLTRCGVYKYAESPDFQILLFGYSVDGGEVQVVDLASLGKASQRMCWPR